MISFEQYTAAQNGYKFFPTDSRDRMLNFYYMTIINWNKR